MLLTTLLKAFVLSLTTMYRVLCGGSETLLDLRTSAMGMSRAVFFLSEQKHEQEKREHEGEHGEEHQLELEQYLH